MDEIELRLFGDLQVSRGGRDRARFPTQRSKALFAYLVLHRDRSLHRDHLCAVFWGERSDAEARKALRNNLWRVRGTLEEIGLVGDEVLRVEGQRVRFVADAWVDVHVFEDWTGRGEAWEPTASGDDGSSELRDRLVGAVSLYRGDLLEGMDEAWCTVERQRFRLAYSGALERLVALHRSRGEWLEAIHWGRQLLRRDPLRENMHRAMMASHLARGDRPSALHQYRECARILEEELDIRPMEQTRRLYERIRDGGVGLERTPPASPEVERLTRQVNRVLEELQVLMGRIRGAAEASVDGPGDPDLGGRRP